MKNIKRPAIGDVVCFDIGHKEVYGTVVCHYTNGDWGAIIPNGFISQGSLTKHRLTSKKFSLNPFYSILKNLEEK